MALGCAVSALSCGGAATQPLPCHFGTAYRMLLHTLLQNAMAQCHIQWLYLAVHGCKTYLNLNLPYQSEWPLP
jgi:hypothetical protein